MFNPMIRAYDGMTREQALPLTREGRLVKWKPGDKGRKIHVLVKTDKNSMTYYVYRLVSKKIR